MIKASELVIGNIVWESSLFTPGPDDFEEIVVGAINDIDKVVLDSQNNIYSYDCLYPIPLTVEWLERFGFIGLNHLGRREYSLVIDEELTIEVCFGDQLIVRLVIINDNYDENINLGQFVTYRHIRGCNYLHQLQNLYFALTGEELTIKK